MLYSTVKILYCITDSLQVYKNMNVFVVQRLKIPITPVTRKFKGYHKQLPLK